MTRRAGRTVVAGFALTLLGGVGSVAGVVEVQAQTVVIEAERIRTAGPLRTLGPATVVIRDGRVASVTEGGAEAIPGLPADAVRLQTAVVLPGFVDARTTVGLSGLDARDEEADETSGPVRPELRAIDAFDVTEPLLRQARRGGVTTIQVGAGDANSIGGQSAIVRTHADGVSDAVIRSPSALVVSLVEAAKETYGADGRFPTTRMGNVSLIRQSFLDAQRYEGSEGNGRELGNEALSRTLAGEMPALVVADRRDEIAGALRIQREFGFPMMLAGGREAGAVLDLLAASQVVILLSHPGLALAGEAHPAEVLGTAAALADRGIPFALVTGGSPGGPALLDWAVETVRHGLGPEAALRAITIEPARLLGIEADLGSIEPGKVGDLVLLDADPFERPARVTGVVAGGRVQPPSSE